MGVVGLWNVSSTFSSLLWSQPFLEYESYWNWLLKLSIFVSCQPPKNSGSILMATTPFTLVLIHSEYWLRCQLETSLSQYMFQHTYGPMHCWKPCSNITIWPWCTATILLQALQPDPVPPYMGFVFDGPLRPKVKRGTKVVQRIPHWVGPCKELLTTFRLVIHEVSKSDSNFCTSLLCIGSWGSWSRVGPYEFIQPCGCGSHIW